MEEVKQKKPFYKKWWVWVVGVFVLLMIVGSTADESVTTKVGENHAVEVPQAETGSTGTAQSDVYAVGDKIQMKKSIISVNEVVFSQGGQFTQPQPGNKWLNLSVTIENAGSSQQFVTTLGQMFVRDGEGNSYQVAVTDKVMESPNNSLDGAIIANSKRTGWVGFEVPEDVTGLQFQYNGSMWGGGVVLVNLGS